MRTRTWWKVAALAGLAAASAVAYARKAPSRGEDAYPPAGRRVVCGGDGERVHLVESGDGRPLVLVHGADGVWLDFPRALVESLARDHRVIVVDRPGHGYSDAVPDGSPPLGSQVDRLRAALGRIGVRRPVLIAHSYGCALALRWALDHPDEIEGLVLLAPAAYYEWPAWVRDVMAVPATRPGRALAETLVPLGRPVLHAANARAFWPQPMPRSYRRQACRLFLRPRQFAALAEEYRWLAEDLGTMRDRYAGMTLPVEILAGERDLVTPARTEAVPLSAELPDAALTLLPDVGHQLHWSHPGEVVAALARLEARLSSAGHERMEGIAAD